MNETKKEQCQRNQKKLLTVKAKCHDQWYQTRLTSQGETKLTHNLNQTLAADHLLSEEVLSQCCDLYDMQIETVQINYNDEGEPDTEIALRVQEFWIEMKDSKQVYSFSDIQGLRMTFSVKVLLRRCQRRCVDNMTN